MRDTRSPTPAAAEAWCRMNEPDADPRGDGEDPGHFRMATDDRCGGCDERDCILCAFVAVFGERWRSC